MKKYLSIDIGGSAIKYAYMSEDGIIIQSSDFKINNDDIDDLMTNIKNLVTNYPDISGIAISSPGTIDKVNKTVSGSVAVECIKSKNWVKELEDEFNIKCSIDNDANCATLAELWIGHAKDYKNVVSVVIGTGIGSTLVVDRKVIYGANKYGAELGYLVHRQGDTLECESNITSTRSLVDRVNKVFPVSNGLEVFQNLDNELVLKEYKSYILDLGIFIYNIVHSYDPELILIGGAISNNEHILQDIQDAYNTVKETLNMSDIELNINTCKFKNDANLIGALYNFLNT